MAKANKAAAMPRELAFLIRTASIYNSMKARFKEKRNKRGRILRIGRELPFQRYQFQDWVAMKLGGPSGTVQCRYCRKFLTAMDLGVDHVEPVSQGGSLGFDNLDICCDECNRLKGNLTLRTFMWVLDAMMKAGLPGEMTAADRKNLESRLKTGGMQYRGKFVKEKPPILAASSGQKAPSVSLFNQSSDEDF